jgi:MerR family transcriptional regulator, light-induced transcriptional regulator
LRTQLLETRGWQDFGDLPCAGETSPAWAASLAETSELPSSSLAGFIAVDVVPGLVLAHRQLPGEANSDAETAKIVEEFASLVLAQEAPALMTYVENLRLRGATIENLYLGLLSATARRFGEFWEEDSVDFASVTIGLWRLQEVLRNLSAAFQSEGPKPAHGHRALLLSTAGEQHTFGLAMLGEFLFRDGWSIAGGPGLKPSEIGGLLGTEFFSIVGLSLSCESRLDALTETIRLVRRTSINRNIVVLVGGSVFTRHPELVDAVGADATAPDAGQGALYAERCINKLGSSR